MLLEAGALISGRYRLGRLLGEGGMGSVWAATHVVTRKAVALKFLKGAATPEATRRFMREARAASAVRHPNVIQVHDILALEGGQLTMVMDLLEGESLSGRLKRLGRLAWEDLSALMLPVVSGVGAAHAAGIVHRDLKPDNIFLSELSHGRVQPMVLDFGICKLNPSQTSLGENTTLTADGMVVGTPYYMAPEQLFGDKNADARTDVWALGVIMYESATGRRPFGGDNLGQLVKVLSDGTIVPLEKLAPDYPPVLAGLINRMLAPDRNQRPPDLREPFAILNEIAPANRQVFGRPAVPPPAGAPLDSPVAVQLPSKAITNRRQSAVVKSVAAVALAAVMMAVVAYRTSGQLGSSRRPMSIVNPATGIHPAVSPSPESASEGGPRPDVEVPIAAAVGAETAHAEHSLERRKRSRPAEHGIKGVATTDKRGSGKLAGGIQGVVPF